MDPAAARAVEEAFAEADRRADFARAVEEAFAEAGTDGALRSALARVFARATELQAECAAMDRRAQAKWERNAPQRDRALRLYETTQTAALSRTGVTLAASASWMREPAGKVIW